MCPEHPSADCELLMMSRRRWFVVTSAVIALSLLLQQRPARGQSPDKPNIVVIMIDDYDFASLATLVVRGMLPNITRYFLQAGYTFTDAFSVAGLGGPSRATFLTGQYPHNHGVEWGFPPSGVEALDDSSTVATWLQSAGYRTGHMGRYVTGYGWWTSATAIPPGWNDWKALLDPSSNNLENYKFNFNGTVVDVGAISRTLGIELHQVDVLGVLARDFIRQTATAPQPFFLLVTPGVFNFSTDPPYNTCPVAPYPYYDPLYGGSILGVAQKPAARHLDTIFGDATGFPLLQPPSFNEADVSDKPTFVQYIGQMREEDIECLQKRYWRKLEVMRAVDDMVGTVMGELESNGKLANTVAVFTGDNGWLDGQHRVVGKGVPYDEALRVPLIIRTRGNTQPRLVTRLVLNTDLAPTIAQFAQATPTHAVDGRSLLPLLQNPETAPWRRIGLFEYIGGIDPFAFRVLPPSYSAIRTDRTTRPRLYARYDSVNGLDGELYDLALDPYQMQNRYTDPGRVAERDWLELWLGALKACSGTGCQALENYFFFN